jgi:outer membrane protein TolC
MNIMRRAAAAAATALTAALPLAGQQELTLAQVYTELKANNAQLAAVRAAADATALRQSATSVPSDPSVQIGLMNLSLPSLRSDMPTAMTPAIQLMQMIPFPGKLSLAGRIAAKSAEAAVSEVDEVWWELRARAAMSFYELYSLDAQLVVMHRTLALLEDFQVVARAMYSAGNGRQSDVLRANVETARMQADIQRMLAMRAAAAAKLNGLMNRPAAAPIESVRLGDLPATLPARDTLLAWAEAVRPMLLRARTLAEQAALRRTLASRELWPDFTVGIEYGQRRGDMGIEHMGSVMFGFTLPVFAGRRQLRMRDEATAMERMARAELAALRTQVDSRVSELLAATTRNIALIDLYRGNIIPQAEATVQSAFSAYRVGTVDFMTLIDSQMMVNRYRQEMHAMIADHGTAIAELEMTIGRELPVSARLTVEDL